MKETIKLARFVRAERRYVNIKVSLIRCFIAVKRIQRCEAKGHKMVKPIAGGWGIDKEEYCEKCGLGNEWIEVTPFSARVMRVAGRR